MLAASDNVQSRLSLNVYGLNILYMSYTPLYCRHPTRRDDAKPGRADCRLVAESAGLRAAPNLLERECLGPERISARVIEVGFSIVLIRRSGRPASSLDEGRPLRLSCLGAVSVHCGLSGASRLLKKSPRLRDRVIGGGFFHSWLGCAADSLGCGH